APTRWHYKAYLAYSLVATEGLGIRIALKLQNKRSSERDSAGEKRTTQPNGC
ncbi:hypothetical protein BSPWISOXPB_9459, partial [uncultured Gammaproteobacteria bacterium]